jgi:hypothetical protein
VADQRRGRRGDLDRWQQEIMELMLVAKNRADAPENPRISELFKLAKDAIYRSVGLRPANANREQAWNKRRARVWNDWCARNWRIADGTIFVMSSTIANGYITVMRLRRADR